MLDLGKRLIFFPFLDFFFIKASVFDRKEELTRIEGSIGSCALLSLNH